MDFSFTADQDALRDLARRIVTDATPIERINTALATSAGYDEILWRRLGEAGLITVGLPEPIGGGFGWLESMIVVGELARRAAPVPGVAAIATAPSLIGIPELLDGVSSGEVLVVPAVHEPAGDVSSPAASVHDGKLNGTKVCVPAGAVAARFVVTALDGLYAVEAGSPGVRIEPGAPSSGLAQAMVTFDHATALRLGGPEANAGLLRQLRAAAAIAVAASCEAALAMTAEYAIGREQFGRPIAAFQAVSQRAGDAYIDTEACRLTAWHAAWRMATGLDADEALLTAKFWAAEGGWRVVHAAHHLHGGFGVDRDYPLHRHFLQHKELELWWGSATTSLRDLGSLLVR